MSLLCFQQLTLLDRYATNRNDLVTEFYGPCLEHSVAYDRAVGYFRSSMFLLATQPIADFAIRGGRMRLICSPELTEADVAAFEQGYQWREAVGSALLRTIEQALLDTHGKPIVEFAATLIGAGCLDIRIAFRPATQGIFHDKVGILRDSDGHTISFTGSINETMNAWDAAGNHESFDVFCSWTSDTERVQSHAQYFESLWNGHEPGVETIHFPKVARDRLIRVANTDGLAAAHANVVLMQARRKTPQPHQVAAIENWRHHGRKGILQHATGSGKTITAITAMREWLAAGHPVLVLVPSELLLEQWYREVTTELIDLQSKVLLVGGGHYEWRKRDTVEGFSRAEGGPRIILATLQTASGLQFRQRIQSGAHLMMVIDEVHRAGSPSLSAVFNIDAGARLGLSATPQRYGDPEGTRCILTYFDGILDPPFTLADAITAGRLCPYTYHVHPVNLNDDETLEWRRLTQEIGRRLARTEHDDHGMTSISEDVKTLLIRRARIIKKAAAKIPLAADVLEQNYEPGQRWLVYCDDKVQLNHVIVALRRKKLPCDEYHSDMIGDPDATLDHFMSVGGILVAIRCLDEGVDIPTIDHALILASSRNPREFIQRRGRVLRRAQDKFFAEIHDALVVPPVKEHEPEDIAILRGEIARALEFANSATNTAVRFHLRQLAHAADLDLSSESAQIGFEDEEVEVL